MLAIQLTKDKIFPQQYRNRKDLGFGITLALLFLLLVGLVVTLLKAPNKVSLLMLSGNFVILAISGTVFIKLNTTLRSLQHKSLEKPIKSITYQFVLYLICFTFDTIVQILGSAIDALNCNIWTIFIIMFLYQILFNAPVVYILYANYQAMQMDSKPR